MHKKCIPYKDTMAAPGSDLYKALTEAPLDIRAKVAKDVYTATRERAMKLLGSKT